MDDWKYFLSFSEHLPIAMAVIVSCKPEDIPELDELKKLALLPVCLFDDAIIKPLTSMLSLVDKESSITEV